jgi:RNA polymerase sigma-70 factor, ECF subfamily
MSTIDAVSPSPLADIEAFLAVRPRLFGIAYRIVGSAAEADEVVQDTWIRWDRAERGKVGDAKAFLATVATRLAINVTQSAGRRRETHMDPWLCEPVDPEADPAHRALRGEALEETVLTLLEKLSPAERAVFVLREAFDYPYRQVARVLELSEPNARQLATRARRHLAGDRRFPVDEPERQRLLEAVVAAAQGGRLAALERVLVADIRASAAGVAAVACDAGQVPSLVPRNRPRGRDRGVALTRLRPSEGNLPA